MAASNLDGSLNFYIDGPAAIYFGAQQCNSLPSVYPKTPRTLLGMTDGGVTVSSRVITHRINGDEFGGNEGIPAELLILGAQASIRATIVKWNSGAFAKIASGAYLTGTDEGAIPAFGSTYFGGDFGFSFWVVGNSMGWFFPKCELATQPREWNVSSLERRMQLNVNAYNVFTGTGCAVYLTGTDSCLSEVDAACNSTIVTG